MFCMERTEPEMSCCCTFIFCMRSAWWRAVELFRSVMFNKGFLAKMCFTPFTCEQRQTIHETSECTVIAVHRQHQRGKTAIVLQVGGSALFK